jgi:hypothetical protein
MTCDRLAHCGITHRFVLLVLSFADHRVGTRWGSGTHLPPQVFDGVEVTFPAHRTCVKPQFDTLFQRLVLRRGQSSIALYWLHSRQKMQRYIRTLLLINSSTLCRFPASGPFNRAAVSAANRRVEERSREATQFQYGGEFINSKGNVELSRNGPYPP